MRDTAILLAGGHGRRAGGPKACKLARGRPWWRVQAEAMASTCGGRVIAVLHPAAWQSPEPPQPSDCAVRADADASMLASLHVGLVAAGPCPRVWVLPVDCPWPGDGVAAALAAATTAADGWLAARPMWSGDGQPGQPPPQPRGGHPLLLSAAGCTAVARLDPRHDRLDHWLQGLVAGLRLDVAVADPSVLANFNADGMSR